MDGQIRDERGEFEEVNGEKVLAVKGRYSYLSPDGNIYLVTYVADQNGYRAVSDPFPGKKSLKSSVPLLAKRINPRLVASLTGGAG